jgi:hypothetical protein
MALEITLVHENGIGIARCTSFAHANSVLRVWSAKAHPSLGYDKINYNIVDGRQGLFYSGQYDLKSLKIEEPDLGGSLMDYFAWVCGRAKPAHCTSEQYSADIQAFSPAMRGRAAFYLDVVRRILDDESTPAPEPAEHIPSPST